eukprot:gene16494-biopygen8259
MRASPQGSRTARAAALVALAVPAALAAFVALGGSEPLVGNLEVKNCSDKSTRSGWAVCNPSPGRPVEEDKEAVRRQAPVGEGVPCPPPSKDLYRTARSSEAQRGSARSSNQQQGAAHSSTEQHGAARSTQSSTEQHGAHGAARVRSSTEQPGAAGAARSSTEQPGAREKRPSPPPP